MAEIEKQIEDLARSIEQKRQILKDLEARQKNDARKNDTRRKVIYGAALLAGMRSQTTEEQERILRWLHKHVTNGRDRAFLGLTPLPVGIEARRNHRAELSQPAQNT